MHIRSLLLVTGLVGALVVATSAFAQECPDAGTAPTPTEVAVTAVPIVVASTTDDYFVLYVSHEVDADTTVHIPVSVTRGETGSTTLAEHVEALPAARYKVEKYAVAIPASRGRRLHRMRPHRTRQPGESEPGELRARPHNHQRRRGHS